ncbi:hypothetical protein ACFE04_013068 [Oxalis oulophora]
MSFIVTGTPLWRNGPPDKPVLCNACGSRWRTKGTLANYTPLHARAEHDGYDDHRFSRLKSVSVNKMKEVKLFKKKPTYDNFLVGVTGYDNNNQGFRIMVDEDTSNRSSSGSAISNSESCAQFGSQDASDLTGPAQSNAWEPMVPSKKRTCLSRSKPSPVEKLTKDLCTILHEQQSSSYFSGTSEEELLFESETPMVSVEIGHGSVLIRHPSTIAQEEESEASSYSIENKQYLSREAYSHPLTVPAHKGINYLNPVIGKAKNPFRQGMQQDQHKRGKSQHEKLQVLGSHKSPLCNIDLGDIVNYEEFTRNLTNEEQQQLLKYLPALDVAKLPDSIKSMFNSLQFKADLSSFQHLLGEGVFDSSFPGAKNEDCKTLKRLALVNLTKSKWVGHHNMLKKCKTGAGGSIPATISNSMTTTHVGNGKRTRDNFNYPDGNTTMHSPRRVIMKANCESKEIMDDEDGSSYSPKSIFALPPDGTSLMLNNFHFVGDSSDQDLLLDVPFNGSFPMAELLPPNIGLGQQASTSSSSVNPHFIHP